MTNRTKADAAWLTKVTSQPGYGIDERVPAQEGKVTITPLTLPHKEPVFSLGGSPDVWPESEMNKAERKFRDYLETLKAQGVVKDYKAQSIKLMLARNTGYTADFFCESHKLPFDESETTAPYGLYFLEVKALWGTKMHWEDDARAKTKIAAKMYPQFRFIASAWDKSKVNWMAELIRP